MYSYLRWEIILSLVYVFSHCFSLNLNFLSLQQLGLVEVTNNSDESEDSNASSQNEDPKVESKEDDDDNTQTYIIVIVCCVAEFCVIVVLTTIFIWYRLGKSYTKRERYYTYFYSRLKRCHLLKLRIIIVINVVLY